MIPTSSAYAAANVVLAKKPIWLIQIADYSRAFTNRSGLDGGIDPGIFFPGLSAVESNIVLQSAGFGNPGGFTSFPGTVTLKPHTAGNILLAFMVNGDGNSTPGISDTAGSFPGTHILNNLACPSGLMNVWWAAANG